MSGEIYGHLAKYGSLLYINYILDNISYVRYTTLDEIVSQIRTR